MAELKERYAQALFELALESNSLEQMLEQAALVQVILEKNQLEPYLSHPHISNQNKEDLLQSLFAQRISKELLGFLSFAIVKKREALILPTLSAFLELGNQHRGKMTAKVVSAVPLQEEQLSSLRKLLSDKLKKQVKLQSRVDPAVIGGFYIYVDGRLIDRTVRTQLRNIKKSIEIGGAQ